MPREKTTCSADDCARDSEARGWCDKHYRRWMRHGDANTPGYGDEPAVRFWRNVDKSGPQWNGSNCWLWTGCLTPRDYGQITIHTVRSFAHRLSYEWTVGPIPDGLVIDHLCRNPPCVNPAHLEPVTQRVNVLRGESLPARYATRTHCINGHEFAGENVRAGTRGDRVCRSCAREYARKARADNREPAWRPAVQQGLFG